MQQEIVLGVERSRAFGARLVAHAPRFINHRTPIAVAVLALFVIVLATSPVKSPFDGATGPTPASPEVSVTNPVAFRDDTLGSGITFSHLQGDERLTGIDETLGAGACVLDYDNDGWMDLFLVNGTGQTRYYGNRHWWHAGKGHALYRNLGSARFKEQTGEAGLSGESWGMGCVAADFDNDGHTDLLVTNRGANLLYRNNGDGGFIDATDNSGIRGDNWSTSAAVADFDGDGLLDVYVTNYIDFKKSASTYESASQFQTGLPRSFSPDLYVAQANRLYRNLGGMQFEDVTKRAGVGDASGRGLNAVWLDVNRDGRPDILVANGAGTPNAAYINQGDGRFAEAGERYRLNDARGSNGLAIGDVNADGYFDIALSTGMGRPPVVLINESAGDQGTRVFRNRTRSLGVGSDAASVFSGWGIALRDFDNDGRLDLFQANGLATPDPDARKLSQGQPKRLWLQRRAGELDDVSVDSGIALSDTESARSLAVADFDNDGDLDVYVTHNNGLGQLLTNQVSGGHWLGVALQGRRSNRDAVGATVRIRTADGTEQTRIVEGGGFLSSSDRRVHFGLGRRTHVTELAVTWPDGTTDTLENIRADRYVHFVEGGKAATEITPTASESVPDTGPGLRVAATTPAHRIQYLEWLVDSDGVTDTSAALQAAFEDADPGVRAAALNLSTRDKRPAGLALVVEALDDPDTEVRLAALDAAQAYESEASVRWLLRALRDPSPRVRARAADVFRFFFDEEEAVIHRKYLAVPPLIRLLDDPDADVRAAAAEALGAAERYRAIEPLVTRLQDQATRVRVQATGALGLIRDRKAVPPLRAALADSAQPPAVRAHALIALKRLDALPAGTMEEIFGSAIERNGAAGIRELLQALAVLLTDTEHGLVLDRAGLLQSLNRLVDPHDLHEPELKSLMVEVLEAGGNLTVVEPLETLARDPDPTIRLQAYAALVKIDRAGRAAHYRRALQDPSIAVRAAMFRRLADDGVPVATPAVLAGLDHPQTRQPAIRALAGHSGTGAIERLYRLALDDDEPASVRVAALESLIPSATKAPALPDRVFTANQPALRTAALRFWAARLPRLVQSRELPAPLSRALGDPARRVQDAAVDVLLERREPWARRYLGRTVGDADADLDVRRRILDGLDSRHSGALRRALRRIARDRHDPLREPAVSVLVRVDGAASRDLLWEILNDPAESNHLRFTAADVLQNHDRQAVLEALRAG